MDCRTPQTVGILSAVLGKDYFSLITPNFIVLPTSFHALIFESHLAIWFLQPSFLLTFNFGGIFTPCHAHTIMQYLTNIDMQMSQLQ